MKPLGAKNRQPVDGSRLGRELLGLFAIFCGLLFFLSLATFDSRDPWLNHVVSNVGKVHNKAGLFGSYLAGFLYDIMGLAAWVLPLAFCLAGGKRILGAAPWPWWRWTGFMLLGICLCLTGSAHDLGDVEIFAGGAVPAGAGNTSSHGGGIIGHILYVGMVGWMNTAGAVLVWLLCFMFGVQLITGMSWIVLARTGCALLWNSLAGVAGSAAERVRESRAERAQAALDIQSTALPKALPVQVLPAGDDIFEEETVEELPTALPGNAEPSPEPLPDHIFKTPGRVEPAFIPPWDEAEEPQEDAAPAEEQPAVHPDPEPAPTFVPAAPQPVQEELREPQPEPHVDTLVHPMVPRPWTEPEEEGAPPSFFPDIPNMDSLPDTGSRSGKAVDEEADLPPWVLDFEEGRVGVQSRKEAPAPKDDADFLNILWGAEPEASTSPAAQPEPVATPATTASASTVLTTPAFNTSLPRMDAAPAAPVLQTNQAEAAPAAQPAAPEDTRRTPLEELSLSEGTAAAVHALRAAAGGDSQALVVASSPSPSTPMGENAFAGEPEPLSAAAAAPAQVSEPAAHEPEQASGVTTPPPAASGYDGDIRIFEAPPVEAAPVQSAPAAVVEAVRRIFKPVRKVPLPALDLLEAVPPTKGATPRSVLEEKGRSLMTCLKDFGIQGELVGITPGPVVTMFEVRPAPGVRVSRIANLSDDLALALKAVAVRIQAPVPGTDTVGIEIPNEARETVCLKELLGSAVFRDSASLLTLALGKDIAGLPAVADLATMPHLLVAGATGAGKSVGINSIILSLIYKARPDQVKLLLIDPKRVEMAIYADLPHLVHPVVTEMPLAKNALDWAVAEMEERYKAIGRAGVRNIADYNAKVASFGDNPPAGMEDLQYMPYLVIVIDELADLMLVAAKEVETSIVRLAQLARAGGIHLILATQRPSVDVVTGLIKANFPCRISFQVTSKHDSRTILDTVGAEHLLGKGDMLFKPGGGKFRRMHGAFVSDKNVNSVVDYWKSQLSPDYRVDFADWVPEGAVAGGGSGGGGGNGDVASDPLYNEAVEFVRQQGKASISLIQRKFRIGFNKAARFVEQMEQDGVIGPADGSKPRVVIR